MQFNNSVDGCIPDPGSSGRLEALKTKLSSGKRARFADAIVAAAGY